MTGAENHNLRDSPHTFGDNRQAGKPVFMCCAAGSMGLAVLDCHTTRPIDGAAGLAGDVHEGGRIRTFDSLLKRQELYP